MNQQEIDEHHYELYKAVEGKYKELIKEGKGSTVAGNGFAQEMDYWFSRLPKEKQRELVVAAKKELEEAFSKAFGEAYPKMNE